MICDNLTVKDGVLYFAGQNTVELAKKYGTPLYLLDEDKIREKCRIYKHAFEKHFGPGSQLLYASKANCFKQIYEIMTEEKMGIDVVSSGEIYVALKAGYDLSDAYFHSNNKTDEDIAYAMEKGIGYFVADNVEEVKAVEKEAARRGIKQKLLLRLTPGIDPHTYEAIATGKVDSKFGTPIETGQADEIVEFTLKQEHILLEGFHCHVGSQVFGEDIFERAAVVMLEFIAAMRDKYGYTARVLDLGGGYGVRYIESDPYLDIEIKVGQVAASIKETCRRLNLEMPEIHMEPGRSIVADAGMTLYTVGTVKKIPGYKNYVSIDGGMPDNPRFALYRSSYTCLPANKMDEKCDFQCSVVGRCCESGDIIQEHVMMPESIGRYDTVAVCTTGAYNYSMASNYNKLPRPPIVMLRGGRESYVAVKRESFEDLVRNDV
ncbi:MAG: diaminopimelate decarboxylase [Anaerovoracaceae bacterium]|nr:diaminopimelate decarboxylase [Anaerovoracaceae bacterium]